ncbi:MAG: hypothetical protein IH933_13385 [Euryarchaeota archaeon]|jgi:hypothetical protein|nr:hypothetical protein [Euryarchaeota archaeon]
MSDIGYVRVEWPYARIRRELAVEDGVPIRFVYQLEYNTEASLDGLPPHDWRQVARFDHDVDGPHDVTNEGLHIDLYRDGEKYEQTYDFPRVELTDAPDFCQQYLQQNADYLLGRFERSHDVGKRWV